MVECSYSGCSWRSIAPSESAAWRQYAEHIVGEHGRTVSEEIPDGMVQVKLERDGDWITTTVQEARRLHDAMHED